MKMKKMILAIMMGLIALLPYTCYGGPSRGGGHARSESSGREHDRAEGTTINEDMDEEEEHMGIGPGSHRGVPIDEVLVGPPRPGDPYYDYVEKHGVRDEERLRDKGSGR